jgi:hypothetical protein
MLEQMLSCSDRECLLVDKALEAASTDAVVANEDRR